MNYAIALMPGDGIGPEVTIEAVVVLDAVGRRFGHSFEYTPALVGGMAIDATGDALPEESLNIAKAIGFNPVWRGRRAESGTIRGRGHDRRRGCWRCGAGWDYLPICVPSKLCRSW